MVYGREWKGRATTFGTTGYTYNNTFVLYDRASQSLWYPMDDGAFTAISGPRKSEKLPFFDKPPIMTLGEWRKLHPDTRVLLGDRGDVEPSAETPEP